MIEVDVISPVVSSSSSSSPQRKHHHHQQVIPMEWLQEGVTTSEHRRRFLNKYNNNNNEPANNNNKHNKKKITILPIRRDSTTKVQFNLDENQLYPKENDEGDDSNNNYLTESEIKAMWYTGMDIALNARKERKLAAQDSSRGNKLALFSSSTSAVGLDDDSEDQFTLRGLEDFSSLRAALHARNRRGAVRKAVLDEQRKQTARDLYDPDKLRDKSVTASRKSRDMARQLAIQDEDDVLQMQRAESKILSLQQSQSIGVVGTFSNKEDDNKKLVVVSNRNNNKKKKCRFPSWATSKKNLSIDKEEHDVVKKKKKKYSTSRRSLPPWPSDMVISRCGDGHNIISDYNRNQEEEKMAEEEEEDIILPPQLNGGRITIIEPPSMRHDDNESGYDQQQFYQLSYRPRQHQQHELDRESPRMLLVDHCYNTPPQQQQHPYN